MIKHMTCKSFLGFFLKCILKTQPMFFVPSYLKTQPVGEPNGTVELICPCKHLAFLQSALDFQTVLLISMITF